MCEELELEASLKLHLHRKENEKLKFNNRRILKGLTHILHMDHGDHTLTLQGPWRPHTYYTCTMETTQPLNVHHGDHTSTTHKPCMNTHPHHTDYSRTHTRTEQIMHLCHHQTSLSNTSLKNKDVLSICTLAASWDEGKQRTCVRYGHSI